MKHVDRSVLARALVRGVVVLVLTLLLCGTLTLLLVPSLRRTWPARIFSSSAACKHACCVPPTSPHASNDHHHEVGNSSSSSTGGGEAAHSSRGVAADYDASTAWTALHFCKAAYCPVEVLANWTCGAACNASSDFHFYRSYDNTSYGTLGFSGVSPARRAIVFAFRGSYNVENWIEDLSYWTIAYPDKRCGRKCYVHRGFYHAYASLREGVLRDIATLHAQHPSYSILVTGHSLGGAIALLCAIDLRLWQDDTGSAQQGTYMGDNKGSRSDVMVLGNSSISTGDDDGAGGGGGAARDARRSRHPHPPYRKGGIPLELYTFGEPRVGNAAFTNWSTAVLATSTRHRLTHGRDVVPHLPPKSWGYVHVPHELWFHMGNESDVYKTCNDSAMREDGGCSDSVWMTTVADHLYYLGVCTHCRCTAADRDAIARQRVSARVQAIVMADHAQDVIAHHSAQRGNDVHHS